MSTIFHPFLQRIETNERDRNVPISYWRNTTHYAYGMFTPIQSVTEGDNKKSRDLFAYLTSPVIEIFILQPAFLLEACIHFINFAATLVKVFAVWTKEQRNSDQLFDEATRNELREAWYHFGNSVAALLSQPFTCAFSIVCWVTRIIGSTYHAFAGPSSEEDESPRRRNNGKWDVDMQNRQGRTQRMQFVAASTREDDDDAFTTYRNGRN